MLFQGEEWAASTPFYYFTDYQDVELAKAVREGRCREFAVFGWKPEDTADPQARETFVASVLNWRELSREPHSEILDWYQRLILLRRSESSLTDGNLKSVQTRFDEEQQCWFVVKRDPICVACNLSKEPQAVPIPPDEQQILMASETGIKISAGTVMLPPDSVAIFKQRVAGHFA
jgi:maltooligosyltrehalose trehalohydrolase